MWQSSLISLLPSKEIQLLCKLCSFIYWGVTPHTLPEVQGRNIWEFGVNNPPSLENLQFQRAKTAVQCNSAGQLTAPSTIGQLMY